MILTESQARPVVTPVATAGTGPTPVSGGSACLYISLMAITLHWFLPTNGDSRTDLSLGNAVGGAGSRADAFGADRAPDLDYLSLVAGAAEKLGFTGAETALGTFTASASAEYAVLP